MSVLEKILGERLAETVGAAAERATGSRRGGFSEVAETPSGVPGGGCCGEPPAKTGAITEGVSGGRDQAAGPGCCGEPAASGEAEGSGESGCCGEPAMQASGDAEDDAAGSRGCCD